MRRLRPAILLFLGVTSWSVSAATPDAAIRVTTAPVTTEPVKTNVLATGVLSAFRKSTVAAEVAGRVVARHLEPGADVAAGAIGISLDPERAALAVKAASAQAEALGIQHEHARHELRRGVDLYRKKVISEDRLDDLRFAERTAAANARASEVSIESARRNLKDTEIRVPFAGHIEAVHVQLGDYVNPGQPVFTITDFTNARFMAGVTGQESLGLAPGKEAVIALDDLGGREVAATTANVGRIKDPSTGTFPVELRIDDHGLPLKEGMVGRVRWLGPVPVADVPTVPAAALVRRNGALSVFTIANNQARQVEVTIGRSDGRRVEIRSGLKAGQRVVVEGLFAISNGSPVLEAGPSPSR